MFIWPIAHIIEIYLQPPHFSRRWPTTTWPKGDLSWITSLVYSVRCGWRGLPWITKTFLSLEMFQKCRSCFLWGRHKGLTSFWARPKFLLHRRYQHGMRYWHYLRESFECSLIYFSKWISHTPQHLNIISNKFLTSCYPTYQRDTAMKWELLLQLLRNSIRSLSSALVLTLSSLHWKHFSTLHAV